MSPQKLKKVYLAGPITGCNPDQQKIWREYIKRNWHGEYEFLCPIERLENAKNLTPYKIVSLDMDAIRSSDAVIANMWKESIGTAIGIAVACFNGKPVIVIDKNHLKSATLSYYAYYVAKDEDEAMARLAEYFRQQDSIQTVEKSGGTLEPFNLVKLVNSIRKACESAGQNDLLAATEIVPRVLKKLVKVACNMTNTVKSSQIKDAVFKVLAELDADEDKRANFLNIGHAWLEFKKSQPQKEFQPPASEPMRIALTPSAAVRIHSGKKSHKLLWGKMKINRLKDLPSTARPVFEEICKVEGIEEIKLGRIGGVSYSGPCVVRLTADKKANWIRGTCWDKGKFGGEQEFEIRVSNSEYKNAVLITLRKHLQDLGMYRSQIAELPVIVEPSETREVC